MHCGVQRTFVRLADSEQEWDIDTPAAEGVKMMMMMMMMVLLVVVVMMMMSKSCCSEVLISISTFARQKGGGF